MTTDNLLEWTCVICICLLISTCTGTCVYKDYLEAKRMSNESPR